MISKTLAAIGLSALALVGASHLQVASGTPPALPGPGALTAGLSFAPKQDVKANGAAICNCTGADAELTVCHAQQVTVRVGNSVLSVNTGQSSTSCAAQSAAPGTCLYLRYSFICSYRGFFVGWECHFNSAGLRDRRADPKNDC